MELYVCLFLREYHNSLWIDRDKSHFLMFLCGFVLRYAQIAPFSGTVSFGVDKGTSGNILESTILVHSSFE